MRSSLLRLLMLLLLPAAAFGQWTRLPLFAGHADRLVQNKYKPNEIFAIVQNGGIYRCRDFGETWTTLVNDLGGSYPGITQMEVAATGDLYGSDGNVVWISRDEGGTWTRSPALNAYHSGVIAHRDSTLFLLSSSSDILRSRTLGASWDTLRPSPTGGVMNIHVDPFDSKVLFCDWLGKNLVITTDGGGSWKSYPFPFPWSTALSLDRVDSNGRATYLMWMESGQEFGSAKYDLIESNDTGATWHKRTREPLLLGDGGSWRFPTTALYFGDTYVFCCWNAVFRSTDAGVTWKVTRGQGVWDIRAVPAGLLLSTTFDGVQLSTDTCRSWFNFRGTRGFPGSTKMEVAVATKDVLYATLLDNDYLGYTDFHDGNHSGYSHAEFLRSRDGGDSWEVLFSGNWLEKPVVRRGVDTRYFAVTNRNTIVTGMEAQIIPDTVLREVGTITEFTAAEVYPNDLYVTAGSSLYVSTDAGASWMDYYQPSPFMVREFGVRPSPKIRGSILMLTRPEWFDHYYRMGLLHSDDFGKTATWTLQNSGVLGSQVALCEEDLVYWSQTKLFSTDFGVTWSGIYTGMNEDDKALLLSGSPFIQRRGVLISGHVQRWLCFRGGSWRRLMDRQGISLSRTLPGSFDFIDDALYAVYPNYGLYRARAGNLVTGIASAPSPAALTLECYPNPVTDRAVFSYTTSNAGPARLQLVNALGAVVYERQLDRTAGDAVVDFAREVAGAASSGVLLARILAGDGVVVSRVVMRVK